MEQSPSDGGHGGHPDSRSPADGLCRRIRETRRINKRVAAGEIEMAAEVDVRGIADAFSQRQQAERADIVERMNSARWIY
ncbi:hypothetical protein M3B43_08180 [Nesterenkonia massiliensis]|uniref:Uncharacterized protein n=1 Tax=Nesterenkonia massiliensis TaxID=1232429 RepID=A0ABT2HRJ3_9MICC|nr:hypothetical protein [Nesterenkonia massiliensis]MCT1607302.1 hypothetical protein [Nesterenkonia massiliensis]